MRNLIILIMLIGLAPHASAHVGPNAKKKKKSQANYRFDCAESRAEVDMDINNVRVRLQVGGDLFTDFSSGRYIVPKRDPASGLDEVSSIYSAAVWMGGVLPGVNPSLKIACQDYRSTNGVDFYPGPLSDANGSVNAETCLNWDRFFGVQGESIRMHLENVKFYQSIGEEYPADKVPFDVKGWPAIGNPFFTEIAGFELPDAAQGLGNFWDSDAFGLRDGLYDPTQGDYPIVEIRGCPTPHFPDEMQYWIFNDAGNRHEVTEGTPIRMEVQVQAFAYKTLDEINNMTFYRYKLINRAQEPIDSTFFAMWMDPDLGCPEDDYVGCDSSASLMYVYNQDAIDGNGGCSCQVGGDLVPSYCDEVPILGVDYFRGPISEPRLQPDGTFKRVELGMSSFTYYNRLGPSGTTAPDQPIEYYRLLNGYWKDGTPLTYGGSGYQSGGPEVKYALSGAPDEVGSWSMCSEQLVFDDRRTLQASGPFRMDPGAINELFIGVIWLPEADYPCPSIQPLLRADQRAQNLFDDCFIDAFGPDAPTMTPLELDQEVVFTLVNEQGSNNEELNYREQDPSIAGLYFEDSTYKFEGYRIYQLADASVTATTANFNDVDKAREVLQLDLKNSVSKIYNWSAIENPFDPDPIWIPMEMVDGKNEGIAHSFNLKEDAFQSTNPDPEGRRLINFKKYYYAVIAYAHNNFDDFDTDNPYFGQRRPYIAGAGNVKEYTVVPRNVTNIKMNSFYGEGLEVTRLDGDGVMNNTLMISSKTRKDIARHGAHTELTWINGGSPLNAKVYDAANIKDGSYLLSFEDFEGDPMLSETKFKVEDVSTGEVYKSESTIDVLNEELIQQFGFSVFFSQGNEPGTNVFGDETNGFLGSASRYGIIGGVHWYDYVGEGTMPSVNFVKTDDVDAPDYLMDPNQVYTAQNSTGFYPFLLCAYDTADGYTNPENGFLYSPSWFDSKASQIRRKVDGLSNLNNIDIVFTSDKDLWSKCIVVQSANYSFQNQIADDNRSMDLLARPSVTKEADRNNDNLPADANDGSVGYSYFPGYAVDVETGKRLNIFFGENTFFSADGIGSQTNISDEMLTGDDRIWNPNFNDTELNGGDADDILLTGGQHYIFVTDLEYDGCQMLHDSLLFAASRPVVFANIIKQNLFKFISWSGYPRLKAGKNLKSYKDGLIPNDLTISLRVKNSFKKKIYTGDNNGFNQYLITIEGKESEPLVPDKAVSSLDVVNVVPNPYYGFSSYENNKTATTVKMTNLPSKCTVNIFTLDGTFVRQFERNEQSGTKRFDKTPFPEQRFATDVHWDLTNFSGKPIVGGVYFIHVKSEDGERVIKWFAANRQMK